MPTNNFVENSFWNFDALFTPQKHPARDAQDTFFLSDPAVTTKFPAEYLEKVKQVHSTGAFGSIGYQYDWQLEETQKNVLRTHTTAVSTRMLYKLAQEVSFKKTFSMRKVIFLIRNHSNRRNTSRLIKSFEMKISMPHIWLNFIKSKV